MTHRRNVPFLVSIVAVLAALLTGTYLRVWDLGDQIVQDDEFHTFRAGVVQDAAYLVTHNHLPNDLSDYGTPLALWNRLLVSTVGLGEWGLRAPVLVAGLILLVAASFFCWREFGPLESVAAAWLFAISPLLLLYSRFARPYGPAALFTLLALLGWWAWTRCERSGWGVLSASSGALAVYFSLAVLPSVLCIWGLGLVDALFRDRRARAEGRTSGSAMQRWLFIVALGVVLIAVLLAPALRSTADFVSVKIESGRSSPTPSVLWAATRVLLGTQGNVVTLAMLVLAGLGSVVLWKRERALTAMIVAIPACQVAAFYVVAPLGSGQPMVVARYWIAALPGLLILIAFALAYLARGVGRLTLGGRNLGAALMPLTLALAVALIASSGPIGAIYVRPNAFTSHNFNYSPPHWKLKRELVPRFYETLAQLSGDSLVLEVPWTLEWGFTIYGDYQRIHGHDVKTAASLNAIGAENVHLAGHLRPTELDSVQYAIVHRDIMSEMLEVTGRRGVEILPSLLGRQRFYRQEADTFLQHFRGRTAMWRRVYEDAWITAWQRVTK